MPPREIFGLRRKPLRLSEDLLLSEIRSKPVPKHVAIITDGNGRWAKKRGLPRIAGHREGTNVVKRIVEAAPQIGIEYLTFYAFSTENWRRPEEEVSGIMGIIEDRLAREISELAEKGVRIKVIGQTDALPVSTAEAFAKAEAETAGNDRLTMIIALNYGGRAEITDAVRRVASEVAEGKLSPDAIDEERLAANLYTAGIPDPELLIRTSGEMRISNFLLWQIAYAEIWVSQKLWPDFSRIDFFEAVHDFQNRKRRFGGVDQV